MRFLHISFFSILTTFGLASPADVDGQRKFCREVNHVVHERRDHSAPWKRRDALDRDVVLPMRIGLRQSNLDKADDLLMEM